MVNLFKNPNIHISCNSEGTPGPAAHTRAFCFSQFAQPGPLQTGSFGYGIKRYPPPRNNRECIDIRCNSRKYAKQIVFTAIFGKCFIFRAMKT